MNWYLEVLKKYTVFTGRAGRKEFWFFVLFNIIAYIILSALDAFLGTMGVLGLLYSLAVLLPGLAVSVRRLHDTNRSGWWVLIGIIPLIGFIVLFVFAVMDSDHADNQYGPEPKDDMA